MDMRERLLQQFIVRPGEAAGLAARDPGWTGGTEFPELAADERQQRAIDRDRHGSAELAEAQELLWASDRYALLVVLQAMDAAGKDSVIKHVMHGVNPQGVQVVSFKKPSSEELGHDFLWRISRALPERGRIGIFNRSHYEEVVALKVHPEWLEPQRLPPGERDEAFWQTRYEDINGFERHLDRSGTKVVKFFLHVSRAAQKERFLARLDQPGKEWKFNAADVAERHALRRVPRRVRGRADGDVDAVGAVVRGPGRPLVDHAGDRRAGARRHPRSGSTCAGPRSRPRRTPRTWRRARSSRPSALSADARLRPRAVRRGPRRPASRGDGATCGPRSRSAAAPRGRGRRTTGGRSAGS